MECEIVWLGHDNSINLLLKEDGVAKDLSDVTKMSVTVNGTKVLSTDKAAGLIRWDQPSYATGECRLFLGDSSLSVGRWSCPLIVYDATATDGFVWGMVPVEVKAEVEGT